MRFDVEKRLISIVLNIAHRTGMTPSPLIDERIGKHIDSMLDDPTFLVGYFTESCENIHESLKSFLLGEKKP